MTNFLVVKLQGTCKSKIINALYFFKDIRTAQKSQQKKLQLRWALKKYSRASLIKTK